MRTILFISASIALFLSHNSSMHHVALSTIQPSTSFLTSKWPLPDSNFFLVIGSFPLCPDTCGGGNTLWIPCSNDLDKWSNFDWSLVCSMCIKLSQNTSSTVQNGFSSNIIKNLLHFQGLVVLILYFSRMDDPAVSQHVCERIIPLRHVLFLTPHGRIKDTISLPFAERTLLPTRLVLPDDLSEHR